MYRISSRSVSIYKSLQQRELRGVQASESMIRQIASKNISRGRSIITAPYKESLPLCDSYDIEGDRAVIASTFSIVCTHLSSTKHLWKKNGVLKFSHQIKIRSDRVICVHSAGILILSMQNGQEIANISMNTANTSFSCKIGNDAILALTRNSVWEIQIFNFQGDHIYEYRTDCSWQSLFRPPPPFYSVPYIVYELNKQIMVYNLLKKTNQIIGNFLYQKASFIYKNQLIIAPNQRFNATISIYNLDTSEKIHSLIIPGLSAECIYQKWLYAGSTTGEIVEIDLNTFETRSFEKINPCNMYLVKAAGSMLVALESTKAFFWDRQSGKKLGAIQILSEVSSPITHHQGFLYAIDASKTFIRIDCLSGTDQKENLNL